MLQYVKLIVCRKLKYTKYVNIHKQPNPEIHLLNTAFFLYNVNAHTIIKNLKGQTLWKQTTDNNNNNNIKYAATMPAFFVQLAIQHITI